jgi:mRNA interferase MazF
MIFDRFDTIVVPFPFSEVRALKRRPVLVLSSARFNRENNTTLVSMITSTTRTTWTSDTHITDLHVAGLTVPCLVRWRLATIPNDLILRLLGKLSGLDKLSCERAFADMIAG